MTVKAQLWAFLDQLEKKLAKKEGHVVITVKGIDFIIDDEDFEKIKGKGLGITTNQKYVLVRNVLFGKQREILLHRLIVGPDKCFGLEVDHISGDTRDNRKSNLRICTHGQNMKNMKMLRTNKLGVKGVVFDKERNKYASYIKVENKSIFLGRFDSVEEAKNAYADASKKYHGEFGRVS